MITKIFKVKLLLLAIMALPFTMAFAGLKSDHIESTYGIKTSTIQITNGAAVGRVLTSDALGNATWQVSPSGVTDHALLTSTGTLSHAQLETNISNVAASTGAIQTQVNNIAVSTGSLQTQINNVSASTGSFQTQIDALQVSTGAIQTQVNNVAVSTGAIQTQVNNIAASTSTFVKKSGDTMTGTLNGTDISMTYGVQAATGSFSGLVTASSVTVTNAINVGGDIAGASTSAFYLGDAATNGTWRVVRSGNDLVYERREAGVYVEKYRAIP